MRTGTENKQQGAKTDQPAALMVIKQTFDELNKSPLGPQELQLRVEASEGIARALVRYSATEGQIADVVAALIQVDVAHANGTVVNHLLAGGVKPDEVPLVIEAYESMPSNLKLSAAGKATDIKPRQPKAKAAEAQEGGTGQSDIPEHLRELLGEVTEAAAKKVDTRSNPLMSDWLGQVAGTEATISGAFDAKLAALLWQIYRSEIAAAGNNTPDFNALLERDLERPHLLSMNRTDLTMLVNEYIEAGPKKGSFSTFAKKKQVETNTTLDQYMPDPEE